MHQFRPFIIFILFLSSTTFATPPEIQTWQQYPTTEVPEAIPAQKIIHLSPIWTLDCGLDSEVMVGDIVAITPGINGHTLLLDSQLVQVLVLNPEGIVANTVGQPGEGPGDFSGAYRLFQLQDGRIGVTGGAQAPAFIMGRGNIVLINPEGEPAGVWHAAGPPGSYPLSTAREIRCANDHLLVASQYLEMNETMAGTVSELSLLDPLNGERQIIGRRVFEQEMSNLDFPEAEFYEPFAYGRCDISLDGRIAYAPIRDQWLVVIRDPDGEGVLLERSWPTLPRSKSEIEAMQKTLAMPDQGGLCKTKPVVGRIRWRPDGKLWVEAVGVELVPGAFACFDEFDPSGVWLRRVQIIAPGEREYDELKIMENGQFGLLRGFKKAAGTETTEDLKTEVLLLEISKLGTKD